MGSEMCIRDRTPAGRLDFERDEIKRPVREDPDFADIVEALDTEAKLKVSLGREPKEVEIAKELKLGRVMEEERERGPRKRVEAALRARAHYALHEGSLFRKVFQGDTFEERLVIPSGGLRAFECNGRRYRLPLRQMVL